MATDYEKEQAAREKSGQEALVKRLYPNGVGKESAWHEQRREENERVSINTVLTTKEHVGNHPSEPNKDDELEANKVGGIKAPKKVETVNISTHADGDPTDSVVVEPRSVAPAPGPNLHVHDAVGIGKVVAEHHGDEAPVAGVTPEIVDGGKKASAKSDSEKE